MLSSAQGGAFDAAVEDRVCWGGLPRDVLGLPPVPFLEKILAKAGGGDRRSLIRAVAQAYLEARYTQREIARHLGVHTMTVSRMVKTHEREPE